LNSVCRLNCGILRGVSKDFTRVPLLNIPATSWSSLSLPTFSSLPAGVLGVAKGTVLLQLRHVHSWLLHGV
jgi:hypothetical protein